MSIKVCEAEILELKIVEDSCCLSNVRWHYSVRRCFYWGGKRGRGSANKVPFVAAVSVSKEGHPMAVNMNVVVKGFQTKEIERWTKGHLTAGSTVVSDDPLKKKLGQ